MNWISCTIQKLYDRRICGRVHLIDTFTYGTREYCILVCCFIVSKSVSATFIMIMWIRNSFSFSNSFFQKSKKLFQTWTNVLDKFLLMWFTIIAITYALLFHIGNSSLIMINKYTRSSPTQIVGMTIIITIIVIRSAC